MCYNTFSHWLLSPLAQTLHAYIDVTEHTYVHVCNMRSYVYICYYKLVLMIDIDNIHFNENKMASIYTQMRTWLKIQGNGTTIVTSAKSNCSCYQIYRRISCRPAYPDCLPHGPQIAWGQGKEERVQSFQTVHSTTQQSAVYSPAEPNTRGTVIITFNTD